MVQQYTDVMITVLFTLWLLSQVVVAGTVAKASEGASGKGASPGALDPSTRARYFSWWKWGSVVVEISGMGMTAAVVIHMLVCTSADFYFFGSHFFLNGNR